MVAGGQACQKRHFDSKHGVNMGRLANQSESNEQARIVSSETEVDAYIFNRVILISYGIDDWK